MAKIPQKYQINHFYLLYTSEYTSVTKLHKIVAKLHPRNNAKYIRYENT